MNFVLQPWQLLVVILTGWLNRRQQAVIDFLLTEVLVLKESNGKRRILLSDEQRPCGQNTPPNRKSCAQLPLNPTGKCPSGPIDNRP